MLQSKVIGANIGSTGTKSPKSAKSRNYIWENVPTAYLYDCRSCDSKNTDPLFEFVYSITSSISVVSTYGLK